MQQQQIKEEEIEDESKGKPDVQKSWMKSKRRRRNQGGDRRRQVGSGKKYYCVWSLEKQHLLPTKEVATSRK